MQPSALKTTHFFYVDLLRFLVAAGVVFFHFGTFSGLKPQLYALEAERAFSFLGDWTRFGWVGVPFFFVLSGVVIAKSASTASPGDFFLKRPSEVFQSCGLAQPSHCWSLCCTRA